MAKQDIIVIGASPGGVTALIDLVRSLPESCKASIFIVLHIPAYTPSNLPAILSRYTTLSVMHPADSDAIANGTIYIAPPDHHMLLEAGGRILIKKGPKENRFRPSIDALFRSAAYVYGPRVIGVVLSGVLDDGTSGLWSVKRLGGTTIIQQPEDAIFPDMPMNVLEYVDVDYTKDASEMGPLLCRLMLHTAPKKGKLSAKAEKMLQVEILISMHADSFELGVMDLGEFTPFTCPECHGALVRLKEGRIIRFRCHTGHAFTASALLAGVTASIEETLWESMRALEEGAMLMSKMGEHLKEAGQKAAASVFEKKAGKSAARAKAVYALILKEEELNGDIEHSAGEKIASKRSRKKQPADK